MSNIRWAVAAIVLYANGAIGQQVIELEGISIIGNPELPKTLHLVPWKRPLPGDLAAEPDGTLLRDDLNILDRTVLLRELRYYRAGFPIE